MRSVIVDDQSADGGRLLENPEFLRFATHWGFRIRACRPHRAQTKGKVERPVCYVRDNFVYGREFFGDSDLNAQAFSGWTARRIPVYMGRRTRSHASVSSATNTLCSSRCRPATTRRWSPSPSRLTRADSGGTRARHSAVEVKRRLLAAYAQLAGGEADA